MACDQCEHYSNLGFNFCPDCGSPITSRKKSNDILTAITVIGCIVTVVLSFVLVFELFVGWIESGYVLDNLKGFHYPLFLIIPTIWDFADLSGIPLSVYYILLLIAVTVCVAFLFFRSYGRRKEGKEISDTPIYEMAVMFGALYAFEVVFVIILNMIGIETDTPSERPTWEWLFELLNASVWEELITRVLYLGIPVAVISLLMKKEGASIKWIGGGFGLGPIPLLFIFFSAFMFGAGHLNGWGAWKFVTTFVFGLIAGYLFCKYGLYVTICFHFLTDYLQAEKWLTGDIMPLTTMAIIIVFFLSIPFIWVYLKRGFLYVRDQLSSDLRRS